MKEKLDSKNIELTKVLFKIKQSLEVEKLLMINAKQINKKAGKTFFLHAYSLAINTSVLDICRILEVNKRYKLNSLPSVINFIEGNNIKPLHLPPIQEYCKKYKEQFTKSTCPTTAFKQIFSSFEKQHKKDLFIMKNFRDISVAHLGDDLKKQTEYLPCYDIREKMLFFGADFYEMIHEAYIGGCPINHKRNTKTFTALHSILSKMGYEEVKKEFNK